MISEENKKLLEEIKTKTDNTTPTRSQDDLLTTVVSKSTPAVVSIIISKDMPKVEVEYVNPFGDDPMYQGLGFKVPVYKQVGTQSQQIGAGTGFIVRSDGYIVTNRHVVFDNQANYTVLLSSGVQKSAKVFYRDPTQDLAIIKIDGKGYSTIPIGNSSNLKLGQTVVAIGNALGEYNNSVSVGIISGLNRTIQAQDNNGQIETLNGVIQTDTAINPGNSGGPLLDLSGNVIGVNVATNLGASNIAFAVPSNILKSLIDKNLK
jgi:S1-C subfamily serine protease